MIIPQSTPRLYLRIVSGADSVEFSAASYSEFIGNYRRSLDLASSEFSISRAAIRNSFYENLHLKVGRRWFRLQALPASEQANRAYDGDVVSLNNLPEYDLQLAILKAGSARDWFNSDEGIWIICQYTWLWGEHLDHFIDTAVSDTFDSISKGQEAESGDFKIRIIRNFERQ